MNTLSELWHLYLSLRVDDPLAASRTHPTAMGKLKEAVMSKGINSRGWWQYLDYGDAIFDQLGRPWTHPGQSSHINEVNALAFLRCETDVLPPVALLRSMARWQIPEQRLVYCADT